MDRWILVICSVLILVSCSNNESQEAKLKMIDKEIERLNTRLHEEQLKAMKTYAKGQGLMIADWDAYAKNIEQVRGEQEEEKQIRLDIQRLEQHKTRLLQEMK